MRHTDHGRFVHIIYSPYVDALLVLSTEPFSDVVLGPIISPIDYPDGLRKLPGLYPPPNCYSAHRDSAEQGGNVDESALLKGNGGRLLLHVFCLLSGFG